ncbi:MAG TPA: ATP-binding protein [Vicinamibacterales bacterium]|nr:ATP-binding protein [Vicinamibacterales bacterium]
MTPGAADQAVRLSVDGLLEGVQVVGYDWTYRYVNAAAARHGQRTVDELVGRTMMACYPGIETTPVFAALQRVMSSRRREQVRNEFHFPGGDSRWFDLVIQPVSDGVCVLSIDVTDEHLGAERQRRIEAQLQQAQKMEALGQLAGGIAHDFNNLLTEIIGYCDLAIDAVGEHPVTGDLSEIRRAGEQAAALTRDLLAFSRKQLPELRVLDLNGVISDAGRMLKRIVGEQVDIDLRLAPDLAAVRADRAHIGQLLMNLVANARDAMPDGGKLTIETRNVELDADYVASHLQSAPGRHVQLAVTDTGMGMAPDVQAHLFEPFFTTKEVGRGTGLGLASVHGIVKQSGGNIWVYSEPGRGTTFKIHLPCAEGRPEPTPAEPVDEPAPVATTVLVVEDNPALQALTGRVLERDGCTVLVAASGEEARAVAAAHDGRIDLLLCDVVLPGEGGPAIARALLASRPDMAVLHMSGYTDDAVVRHGVVDGTVAFIQKPFTPDRLIRKVRDTLRGTRSASV